MEFIFNFFLFSFQDTGHNVILFVAQSDLEESRSVFVTLRLYAIVGKTAAYKNLPIVIFYHMLSHFNIKVVCEFLIKNNSITAVMSPMIAPRPLGVENVVAPSAGISRTTYKIE